MKKTIVIMCKSVKHYPNYCIAGIDTVTGDWIRPISNRTDLEGAVPFLDAIYEDKTPVEVLDVVEIEMLHACPTNIQKENILYDNKYRWRKVGRKSLDEVIELRGFDREPYIFCNTNKSLVEGEPNGTSLLLVNINNPEILIKTFDKKKYSFNFEYNNNSYRYIKIGDKTILDYYFNNVDGTYKLNSPAIAVFSLTGKYELNGKYYKMLAHLFISQS